MLLHIINNGIFFEKIKLIYDIVAPNENIYGVRNCGKKTVNKNVRLIDSEESFVELLFSGVDWEAVIFNPLAQQCWSWLKHIPSDIPVVWYRWVYEAYNTHPYLKMRYLYMSETKKIVYGIKQTSFIRECCRGLRDIAIRRFKPFTRVDYFIGPEKEEFELFKKSGLLPRTVKWMFGAPSCLEYSCENIGRGSLGKDIKVGNSANPSNNHLEVFKMLAKYDLSGRKVLVPLSYGNDVYRDVILEKGKKILGSRFEPITTHMPLQEYNRMMNRCGFVVMNHLRQQAGGNITADLWRGSKVYMNETTSYKARKEWGLSLELIVNQTKQTFFTRKRADEINKDREILLKYLGRNTILEKTRRILNQCRKGRPV